MGGRAQGQKRLVCWIDQIKAAARLGADASTSMDSSALKTTWPGRRLWSSGHTGVRRENLPPYLEFLPAIHGFAHPVIMQQAEHEGEFDLDDRLNESLADISLEDQPRPQNDSGDDPSQLTPGSSSDMSRPPAAPMPASIDLHPPPSPQHDTVDIGDAASDDLRWSVVVPTATRSHEGTEKVCAAEHRGHGSSILDETNVHSTLRSYGAASTEFSPPSSLFVHLGSQAPDEGRSSPNDLISQGHAKSDIEAAPPAAVERPGSPTLMMSGKPSQDAQESLISRLGANHFKHPIRDEAERPDGDRSCDEAAIHRVDSPEHHFEGSEELDTCSLSREQLAESFVFGQQMENLDPTGVLIGMGQADSQQPLQHQVPESHLTASRKFYHQDSPQPTGVEPSSIADQIRQMTQFGAAKSKVRQYGFPAHADSDSLPRELDEFYSYVEAPQVLENKAAWEEWCATVPVSDEVNSWEEAGPAATSKPSTAEWTSLTTSARRRHVRALLANLSSKDPDQRLMASRAFLYILQGSFADTHGPEHQEHWIKLNAKMCRKEGAIARSYEALKKALWKHDFLCFLPDHIQGSASNQPDRSKAADGHSGDTAAPLLTPQSKAEYMEEVNLELTLGFAQLYMLIETGRRDEEEGGDAIDEGAEHATARMPEDLMALDPPMPIYLFTVLAGLREKNARGFPVKKLLLCLWKSLLTCLGGQRDIERCKALARRVEGLPQNPTAGSPPNTLWPPPSSSIPGQAAQMNLLALSLQTSGAENLDGPTKVSSKENRSAHEPYVSNGGDQHGFVRPRLEVGKPRARKPTKATPVDFETFQEELAVKYPTYVSPKRGPADLPIEKLATAVDPLPPRRLALRAQTNEDGELMDGHSVGVQPGTPAPSPPPSPRPGKQKFQTDQSKPFIFPFSSRVQGDKTVPYSIDEADRLYKENMHVSTELWQMWRIKEDMEREERGLNAQISKQEKPSLSTSGSKTKISSSVHLSGGPSRSNSRDSRGWAGLHALSKIEGNALNYGQASPSRLAAQTSGTPIFTPGGGSPHITNMSIPDTDAEVTHHSSIDTDHSFITRGELTLTVLLKIEAEISETIHRAEGDHLLAVLDNDRYSRTLATLHQQLSDVRRLQHVDIIYQGVLTTMQSGVIVLLKLLLATVTAQNTNPHGQSDDGMENLPPPTVEDIDILRHREITTKAISAILLLMLKWFKTSHALKFHHLSQFLVDSNCMLLVLKMFGLQEVANSVRATNEVPNFNFFSYCDLEGRASHGDKVNEASLKPSDLPMQPDSSADGLGLMTGNGRSLEGQMINRPDRPDNVSDPWTFSTELIHDYSFRNFFAVLNFTRILQKLTKRRAHRILLLNQYKSSAILKRLLKVPHPTLQLYILKIIKGQIPFCGRKWRQSNMKVITAIYLNCRPDLRDEWLSSDVEDVVIESLPQEQALRALVKFYVGSRFGDEQQQLSYEQAHQDQAPQHSQNRMGRAANVAQNRSMTGAEVASELEGGNLAGGVSETGRDGDISSHGAEAESPATYDFFESEFLLPPLRKGKNSNGPGAAAYIPDDIVEGYLDEYEEILNEVFGPSGDPIMPTSPSNLTKDASPVSVSASPLVSTAAAHEAMPGGTTAANTRNPSAMIGPSGSPSLASSPSAPVPSLQELPLMNNSPRNSPANVGWSSGKWGLTQSGARSAWNALGEILGEPEGQGGAVEAGDISDSESISSIGELDFSHPNNAVGAANAQGANSAKDLSKSADASATTAEEGKSAWEHLSPKEMRFLASQSRPPTPGSPTSGRHRPRRKSSSPSAKGSDAFTGSGMRRSSTDLRPVLNFDEDDLADVGEVEEEEESSEVLEPLPNPQEGGIDEVEHVFGQ